MRLLTEARVEVGVDGTNISVWECLGGQWTELFTEGFTPSPSPAETVLLLEHAGWHLYEEPRSMEWGWWAIVTSEIEDSMYQRKENR